MEKEFIPYEQALALKELGFDEPCFGYYNVDPQLKSPAFNMVKPFEHEWCLPAPLYQQAFKFFRDKYEFDSFIRGRKSMGYEFIISGVSIPNSTGKDTKDSNLIYDTYEEAELACLNKLIEICKNEQ